MRGRTFTREFKLDVCRQIASGQKRIAQVCREHQLGETVLLRWRKEFAERGEAAFTPKLADAQSSAEQRIAELERVCGQLAVENALLKRVHIGMSTSRRWRRLVEDGGIVGRAGTQKVEDHP